MKNLVINLVAYGPVVGYIIYSRATNVPNSGFNWVELVIVILLGVVEYARAILKTEVERLSP